MTYTDMTVLAGTIDDATLLVDKTTHFLAHSVMALLMVVAVVKTYQKSQSVAAAFVAGLGGAALWFVVMNPAIFRDGLGEEMTPGGSAKSAGAGNAVVQTYVSAPGRGEVR